MSHIVGYVGRVSPEDLRDSDDAALQLPGMRVGKKGVEKGADEVLRGKPGGIQVEVNAAGRVVRELHRADGESGANLMLTIDLELQQFVVERLKEQSASAVVMDVITGDILAMASVPSFDHNIFARGITQAEWQELLSDPKKPLLNKAAQGQYPPASTYKMVTALAALESKAITLTDRLPCIGYIDLPGKQKKYCWIYPAGHGSPNVIEALQVSCDCFFYQAAGRTGVDRMQSRHWPGRHVGDATAAGGDGGAHRQRRLCRQAAPDRRHCRCARFAAAADRADPTRRPQPTFQPAEPEGGAAGHGHGGQQPERYGFRRAHCGEGYGNGRQDRYGPGQAHHRERAQPTYVAGGVAMEPA